MPLSLLLALSPTHPGRRRGFYGRQLQAWFLGQVARHDPGLAQAIHAENGPRPYTVSDLWPAGPGACADNNGAPLEPRQMCFVRLTSLAEPLTNLLLEKFLPGLPPTLELKGTPFKLLGRIQWNDWDAQTTFPDLLDQAMSGDSARVTLDFASPTAFRVQGNDQPLPLPEHVWRSLCWRWNTFAPAALHVDPAWAHYAAETLILSDFHLDSVKVVFKDGAKGAATGCVGRATYQLLPERRLGQLAEGRPGAAVVLRLLAAFARYSGVGHHTTIGLGQARWLNGNGDGRPSVPRQAQTG